jgi:hypothetical protein
MDFVIVRVVNGKVKTEAVSGAEIVAIRIGDIEVKRLGDGMDVRSREGFMSIDPMASNRAFIFSSLAGRQPRCPGQEKGESDA